MSEKIGIFYKNYRCKGSCRNYFINMLLIDTLIVYKRFNKKYSIKRPRLEIVTGWVL